MTEEKVNNLLSIFNANRNDFIDNYSFQFCKKMNGIYKNLNFEWRFLGFKKHKNFVTLCFAYNKDFNDIRFKKIKKDRDYQHIEGNDCILIRRRFLSKNFTLKRCIRDVRVSFKHLKESGY